MVWSHLALQLLSKTRYCRNYRGKEWIDGKTGKRRKQLLDDLRKREVTGNRKRKHYIALCGELALEDSVDP